MAQAKRSRTSVVYQIKVTLKGSKPPIWRRMQVTSTTTLAQLHQILQLSLSRLNHWLPRGQAHPEVMQGTAEFHDQIADAFFPQTDAVFDNATPLDAAVDMLN